MRIFKHRRLALRLLCENSFRDEEMKSLRMKISGYFIVPKIWSQSAATHVIFSLVLFFTAFAVILRYVDLPILAASQMTARSV